MRVAESECDCEWVNESNRVVDLSLGQFDSLRSCALPHAIASANIDKAH